MQTASLAGVFARLRQAAARPGVASVGDGQLLQDFLAQRDEAAITALVGRHGPMVLATCRRVVGCTHDAEDAFQATFLVLVRRAATIHPPEAVGAWLHGVATRIALKARANTARRQARERQVEAMPTVQQPTDHTWNELGPVLDQELQRLPRKLRDAIVLCDLQGKSRREVATSLGIPPGTLSGRVTAGRRILAERLKRRGITLGAGALAVLLERTAVATPVPPSLLGATVQAMALLEAGGATLSATVSLLMKSELERSMMTKVSIAIILLLAIAVGSLALARESPQGPAAPARPGPGEAAGTKEKRFPVYVTSKAFVQMEDATRLRVRAQYPMGRFLKLQDADGKFVHVHEFGTPEPPPFLVELKQLRVHSVRGKALPIQEWAKGLKEETLVFLHVADEEVKPEAIAEGFRIYRDEMYVLILPSAVHDPIDKSQAFSQAKSFPQTFPGRLPAPGDPMPPKK